MPHSFSYAVSMNLEHSIKEGSHERYPDHFQCFRNIKKNKIPWFSGHDIYLENVMGDIQYKMWFSIRVREGISLPWVFFCTPPFYILFS